MLRRWLVAHEAPVILALLAMGVALRTLLVLESPAPFGYVWDFYHEGVRVLYEQGRLPVAADCWQCYHPPLFYLIAWPFYALGRSLADGESLALRLTAALALPASTVVVYYGYRLLRLFGCRGGSLVFGLALLLTTPVLFISSYGAEADIVVTACLSAFIYYLTRYAAHPASGRLVDVAWIGLLAGLAAGTKYNGLVALVTAAIVFGAQLLRGPARARTLRHGAVVLAVCGLVGGWKYADNIRREGSPLQANGSAAEGLALGEARTVGHYEFTTLRLVGVAQLFGFDAPPGDLTFQPAYQSVPTALHALVWSDMSFFSVRSRFGGESTPYPHKRIPVALIMTVIVLGFVPELLAVIGLVVTLRRRAFLPLAVFGSVTLAAYLWWVLPQVTWALKPKYILSLLPPAVVYAAVGQAWLGRRMPRIGAVSAALVAALVLAAHVYLLGFAIGRL